MADLNKQSLEMWNAMKPMVDREIDQQTKGAVQRRKAKVTTAPSLVTKKIGVTEPFGDQYFIPYDAKVAGAKVGDVVWVEYMYGASNAFASMFAKAVEDPRFCSATLSSAGWYRAMSFDGESGSVRVEGGLGAIIKFYITRRQGKYTNEVHEITLDFVMVPLLAFTCENSISKTKLIDKIRYTTAGTVGYIDIHYTGTTAEEVAVCFDVNTLPSYFSSFTAESLQAVADAPSGETVLATHDFVANTHISGSVAGSYGTIYYDRKGGVCSIYGDVNGVPTGAWTTLATGIPAPARTQFFIAQNGASTDFVMCHLNTSGTLKFYGRGSYSSGYPTWTYVCN